MSGIDYLVSTFGGAFAVLLFFTLILWAFLPFSVFGIKKRLDRMAARQRRTNELLEHIAVELSEIRNEAQSIENSSRNGEMD